MAPSVPTDPWSLARERYLATLTDDQKRLFTHASLENVLYTTTAEQKSYESDSKSIALAKKLKPFIDAVSDYGAALDVFSNTYSLIMCPLWGSIRVLLHIANEFQTYPEKLVDMFAAIGEVLQTFRVYERIFSGHHSLLHALSVVYLDIITFCMDAKRVFTKAKLKKEAANERKNQSRERENQSIERAQAQLEKARQLAVQKELKRLQILKRLSNINHESRHRKLRKMRCENTGSWIFGTRKYIEWISKNESCCLWCYGIPGSGKTIITTAVIDELTTGTSVSGTPVVYFYCDYSNSSTLEARGILGNLILQLLSKKPEIPEDIQSILSTAYNGIREPDSDELLDILLLTIKLFDRVFFILDGIDECGGSDRAELLAAIQSVMKPGTTVVKLFLASRADVDLVRAFNNYMCLPISADDIAADIEAFVNSIIKTKITSSELVVRDARLVGGIVDALVDGAQGMFIWVTFQIEDICDETCDSGIRRVLGNLPIGLAETYTRALQKIHTKKPGTAQLAQKIFKWMVCARRPLVMDEIKEAISISPQDRSLDPDKIITDHSRIVQACANLAVFDSDEGTFRFAHYSVQEFLLCNQADERVTGIHFRLSDAEREVGEICITYLSFSQFGTQVARTKAQNQTSDLGLLISPLIFRESYLGWFGKVILDGWARFRGHKTSQLKFNINWGEYLKRAPCTSPGPELEQQYRLLNYVIENWAWHAIGFSNSNTKLWPIFADLALEQQLPFSFWPWGGTETTKDLPYMPMVLWSIDTGHEPLLRLLLAPPNGSSLGEYLDQEILEEGLRIYVVALTRSIERGYDACTKLLLEIGDLKRHEKDIAFHLAAKHGNSIVIEQLLASEIDSDSRGGNNYTALHLAAQGGHSTCVKLLLDSRADPNTQGNNRNTPLHLAAEGGHGACVELLLGGGADPNTEDYNGNIPFRLAAAGGHVACAKLLLEGIGSRGHDTLQLAVKHRQDTMLKLLLASEIDLHSRGGNNYTALHTAAERGYNAYVRLLLDSGADPNTQDDYRNTPLHLAAERGYGTCVESLLGGGADPNTKNRNGRTALHLAGKRFVRGESETCVKLLLDCGANPNIQDGNGNTPLHLAAQDGNYAVAKLLIKNGACQPMNYIGKTPLFTAIQYGYKNVQELLNNHNQKSKPH